MDFGTLKGKEIIEDLSHEDDGLFCINFKFRGFVHEDFGVGELGGGVYNVCGGDWCLFGYGRVFNFGALTCATVEALRDLGLAVIGGVDFGAFGARGFIGAGGRVVAELIAQILILSSFL
jgi:hypothetical protein